MPTYNPDLWDWSTVAPPGPQGPPGPDGVLLDSWWVSLAAPAGGVSMYVRTVFDGAAIQICGSYLPGSQILAGSVVWLGWLPAGYEVTGAHFIPSFLMYTNFVSSLATWDMAGLRINFDAANLVALEVYLNSGLQFFCTVATIPKDAPGVG